MYCILMTSQDGSYQAVMQLLSLKLGDGQWAVSLASVDVDSVAIRHTCVAALNLLIISILVISILD